MHKVQHLAAWSYHNTEDINRGAALLYLAPYFG